MDRIKIYKPPDSPSQTADFIEGLEPKLRDKLARHIPGGSAEHRSFGARLALSGAVFFWRRRTRT